MNWESYVADYMSKGSQLALLMPGLSRFPNRATSPRDTIFVSLESRLMEQRFVPIYGELVSSDRQPSGSRSKEMRND